MVRTFSKKEIKYNINKDNRIIGNTEEEKRTSQEKWIQGIEEIGNARGMSMSEMRKLARDRKAWKDWTSDPTP
ncbi:hypothetical protein QE152_g31325 [Popillia japonica]|uniref:Uncharacterized protein n=1 Tax=Popillia japonica TaxID=7064 RepID=A0AAW1JBK8_POPJA